MSVFLLCALSAFACASQKAFIEGSVTDTATGKPFMNVSLDVFVASDPSNPYATVRTDERGRYNISVDDGNYEIYVRVGATNPRQSVYVHAGEIQQLNFKISMKSISEEQLSSNWMFWVQVGIAALIIGIIAVDQLFFKRKRVLSDLAAERGRLEAELKKGEEGGQDDLGKLRKDRSQLEYMINLTRTKYHQRSINEESFREIIRDYQEKLIEVEARIAALEAEKKDVVK
ncbi:MAG: carboxypeptidase-like regulatory domain-containing protein [Candidatus Altiarchaeota archaeon]|nr:carboxypeptidase-like regulatory domain-containing protein [Candidatus Altiarchaeota archaeon]